MTLLTLMDAIQVHAAAAAVTAGGATFYDVAVGYPAAKGRCVRIYHGGDRRPQRMGSNDETFNSQMMAQLIRIRAYWSEPESATKRQRVLQGEIGTFLNSLRTRLNGDKQLGGACTDMTLSEGFVEQTVEAHTLYVIAELEALIEYDEYSIAP